MSKRHDATTATLDEVQALRSRVAELEHAERERRRIEEHLVESQAREKAILDNIPDAAWLKDRESRYVAVNEAYASLLGLKSEDMVGKTDHDLWPAEWAAKYRDEDSEVIQSGTPRRIEHQLPGQNGDQRIFETILSPVRNGRGEIIGTAGIARDITERIRTEETLQQRIETLTQPLTETSSLKIEDLFDLKDIQAIQDAFAEATGVASVITDTDGRPITRPSNFCRLCLEIIRKTEKGLANCMHSDAELGKMRPDGPTTQPCLSGGLWDGGTSICAGDRRLANWLIGQVLDDTQTEEKMLEYARQIGADVEEYRAALAEVTRMSRDQFDKVSNALFLIARQLSLLALRNVQQARDITARQKAEHELARYKDRLEELVERRTQELAKSREKLLRAERLAAMGTLAGGIAHEINNPVGGILLLAQFALVNRADPGQMAEALEKIVGCAQRCKLIVQNVLAFARTQAATKNPADLSAVTRRACDAVERYAADNGCTLSLRLESGSAPLAMSATGIEQVIVNLLRNAIQAGARRVIVRTEDTDGGMRLAIEDDGAGIEPSRIPRLFDPFFTTRHGEGGTGLGLSIVHGIVTDHGGTIDVASDPGTGTTFTIFLPRTAHSGERESDS